MQIIQGTGWQGTFALAVEGVVRDVLGDGAPVEVSVIYFDQTCKHVGNVTGVQDGMLIFEDGTRVLISEIDTFDLVD